MSKSNPSRTVAVDTMTLVWSTRKVNGNSENRKRAAWLFDELDRANATIIVPSIVVAEYLAPIEESSRKGVLAELTKRFVIAPFDAQCALLAARLWEKGYKGRATGKRDNRKCLRADTLIIATACVHGAREFYSRDKKCRKLAEGLPEMEARDLPDIAPDLFSNADRPN